MPPLLPGFEYDIFISYRHKDNKGDHWVTEIVDALKAELEATFKEDISIYFDTNPHDGLLETHNVDKSLENKLKRNSAKEPRFIEFFEKVEKQKQFRMDAMKAAINRNEAGKELKDREK